MNQDFLSISCSQRLDFTPTSFGSAKQEPAAAIETESEQRVNSLFKT